jgi:hypothetical protein
MQMLVSMNAPIAAHLGDSLLSAATGKSDLHKSATKDNLAAATSQEFSSLLFAARDKGNPDSSLPQEVGKQAQASKPKEAREAEPAAVATAHLDPGVTPARLNPTGNEALPTLNPVAQPPLLSPTPAADQPLLSLNPVAKQAAGSLTPVANEALPTLNPAANQVLLALNSEGSEALLGPHATGKGANDGLKSAGAGERSATTEKAMAGASTPQAMLTQEATDAMLLPVALPNLFAAAPKPESTTTSGDKGATEKADGSSSIPTKEALGDPVLDKSGSERMAAATSSAISSSMAQGQQAELAASRAEGDVVAGEAGTGVAGTEAAEDAAADSKQQAGGATAKPSGTTDLTVSKSAVGTASAVASGMSTSTGTAATPETVRDAAASSATDPNPQAAVSTATAGTTAASTTEGSAVAPTHDAAANSMATAAAHEMPAAPTAPTAANAVHDSSGLGARTEGTERSASTNSGLGSADAHAILDGAGSATGGREGTWQISPNRVEAGFANGQDSWTSVVAQRQQGHVTAMLELGSAAEHSSTTSMLPQLNAHLAERQLPVDQLGVSVRQQFSSDRGAGDTNQGQQSNSSSQSQRAPQGSIAAAVPVAAAPVAGVPGNGDGNRISIRA